MRVRRSATLAAALAVAPWLVLAGARPASAASDPAEGLWVTSNFASVVELSRCEASLCARLVWLWDVGVAGRRKLDGENPDERLRGRPLVGLPLFERFRSDDDAWKGRIYNPEDGRTYRATLVQRGRDVLRLRGCYGPFCRSQTWRRLGSFTLPTPMDFARP